MARNKEMRPEGAMIYIVGSDDAKSIPKGCETHPTIDGRMLSITTSDASVKKMDNAMDWYDETRDRKQPIYILFEGDKSLIQLEARFMCNNACHYDIMPYKTNVLKYFTLKVEFFKRGDGAFNIINETSRKISVGQNPRAEAVAGIDKGYKWSDNFKKNLAKTPAAAKQVNLELDITVKVPKEAEKWLGEFFETTIFDTKKAIQNIANELIAKDISKAKKHEMIMKKEEKEFETEKKWRNEMHDKVVDAWKNRCAELEAKLNAMKNKNHPQLSD